QIPPPRKKYEAPSSGEDPTGVEIEVWQFPLDVPVSTTQISGLQYAEEYSGQADQKHVKYAETVAESLIGKGSRRRDRIAGWRVSDRFNFGSHVAGMLIAPLGLFFERSQHNFVQPQVDFDFFRRRRKPP